VDHPHQRGGPAERHDLQPPHAGAQGAGVEVDRKVLAELAVNDAPAFAALVEVARAALPTDGTGGPAAQRAA
jgi:hypothetical protein